MYYKKEARVFVIFFLMVQTLYAQNTTDPLEPNSIQERFGYETKLVPDEKQFRELSKEELLILNNVLKDLPAHFHHVPQLKGFVRFTRRQNGYSNPDQPDDPSIAHFEEAYIELTDETFNRPLYSIEAEILRLIGLFYYRFVLSPEKISSWDSVSGWTLDRTHNRWMHKSGNFSTTYDVLPEDPTELKKIKDISIGSPEEDFSYAFSFYVTNPTFLKFQSIEKYNFIKEIFEQYEYEITAEKRYRFIIHSPTPDLTPPQINLNSLVLIPHHAGSKTTSVTARCEIWDEDHGSGVRLAYLRLLSPDSKQEIIIFFEGQPIQKLRQGQWQVSAGIIPGQWVVDSIIASDKANNTISKAIKNVFVEILNSLEDVIATPPAVEMSEGDIVISTPNAQGDIGVKITVKVPPEKGRKFPQFTSGTCVSLSGKTRHFQGGVPNIAAGLFTFNFRFSLFDEKGPWYFSQFQVQDENGNRKHFNLPKEEKYKFMLQQDETIVFDTDTEPLSIDEESISIEVIDKNKNGKDIEVHIRFSGPKDKSGLSTSLGRNHVFIRSPNGKRFNGTIQIKGGSQDQENVQYEAIIRLPDHPENGDWLFEEIKLEDRAGNSTQKNFLQRKIKIDVSN